MNKVYKLSKAIYSFLKGEADNEEKALVEEWAAESERHRSMMESFRKASYWEEEEKRHQAFDSPQAYERFRRKRAVLRRRKLILRAAGAAAVLAIAAGALKLGQTDSENAPAVAETIKPGGSKATLVMSTGTTMYLGDSTNLRLDETNAHINIEGGTVEYRLQEGQTGETSAPAQMNTISTPQGGEYKLVLADGTRVWLNAKAHIRFPSAFRGERREVEVDGEAYFEVARDTAHPFIVKTRHADINVIGTSFNVRTYPDEAQKITLVEGKIAVTRQNDTTFIRPGEQWVMDENGTRVRQVKAANASGWKDGKFVFDDVPLSVVFGELERWYNIHVFFGSQQTSGIAFSGIFPRYEDFARVIEIIELAACVDCQIKGQTVTIYPDEQHNNKQ